MSSQVFVDIVPDSHVKNRVTPLTKDEVVEGS